MWIIALIILAVLEAIVILLLRTKANKLQYDGTILVTETDEKKLLSLEIDVPPDTLDQKKHIIFRVRHTAPVEE